MRSLLLLALMALPTSRPATPTTGTCSGVVHLNTDPKHGSSIDCENPCANSCSTFFVMTPCGYGAQCGCSTVGPNSGPDVALVPPSGNGIYCRVGTCPNGAPPDIDIDARTGREDPATGRRYYRVSVRAACGS